MRPARYTAHWIVPVAAPPIENGAVLVDEAGRIAAIGPLADVVSPDDAESVHLGDAALMPGLVNVHAHPELTVFRGLLEDLPFHDWIDRLMSLKRAVRFTAEDWVNAARWACLEAVSAGITTVAATEDSGAAFDAFLECGLRGVVYLETFGPDPAQADASLGHLRESVGEWRKRANDLVRVGVSPHAPYTVSDELFRKVADFARSEELPIAVHAAEAEAEERYVTQGTGPFADRLRERSIAVSPRGSSTVEMLDRLGVLSPRTLLIHCVRVNAEDRTRIAAQGACVAHCPAANARLAHGVAPLAELLDAGITVGLGTDSVASNNRMDMLEEARLAQLFHRAGSGNAAGLPAERLLRMATLDGARALGLDSVTGSLEPGKDADLCAVSLSGPHITPVNEITAALVHAARASDVILTVVKGRALHAAGSASTVSMSTLRAELNLMAERLAQAAHAQ
jgi:5-methylthioadenosine/S-adenosylhomocysteine deaminase